MANEYDPRGGLRRQQQLRRKKKKRQQKILLYSLIGALSVLAVIGIVILILNLGKGDDAEAQAGTEISTAAEKTLPEAETIAESESEEETTEAETKKSKKKKKKETEAAAADELNYETIDGFRYLLLGDGSHAKNMYTLSDGRRLLFTEDGKQYVNCTGVYKGNYYFCDQDGFIVESGWITFQDGSTGIVGEDGKLLTGCVLLDNTVYTFTSDGRLRHTVDATRPMVCLTYDDGPSTATTQALLDLFAQYNSYATFFICGKYIEGNENLIQAIENQGSEVANHTFSHYMLSCMDLEVTTQEISATSSYVQQITGNRPSIVRPPTGSLNAQAFTNAAQVDNGYPLILWSIDTIDWDTHDANQSVQTIRDKVRDGSIVLMHDRETSSVEASRIIVPELINAGYQLVSVSELACARGGAEPGVAYTAFYPDGPQIYTGN